MRVDPRQLVVLVSLVNVAGNVRVKERKVCDSGPCLNGGQCIDLSDGGPHGVKRFQCACPEGYKGVTCQKKIHPCASDPCANGGICRPRGENFHCDCLEGYEGKRCSKIRTRKGTCVGHPCGEHGDCRMINDGIICECDPGYHGSRCQHKRLPPHMDEVKVIKVADDSTDPGIRDLLFIVVALLCVFVLILLCMCIHCCRVYYRRADYKRLQRKRKCAGEEVECLPSWIDTSNRICNEFWCCRGRDSDEHLQGCVSGVIVSAREYERYLWDKDKCNKVCRRPSSYGAVDCKSYSDGGYVIVDPTDDEAEHGIPAAYYPPGAKGACSSSDDSYVRLMCSSQDLGDTCSTNTSLKGCGTRSDDCSNHVRGSRASRTTRSSSTPRTKYGSRGGQLRTALSGVEERDEYDSSNSDDGSGYPSSGSHPGDRYYSDSTAVDKTSEKLFSPGRRSTTAERYEKRSVKSSTMLDQTSNSDVDGRRSRSIPPEIVYHGEPNSSFSSEENYNHVPVTRVPSRSRAFKGEFADRVSSSAVPAEGRQGRGSGHPGDVLRVTRNDVVARDSGASEDVGFNLLAQERMSRARNDSSPGAGRMDVFSPQYSDTSDNQRPIAARHPSYGRRHNNQMHAQSNNVVLTDYPAPQAGQRVYEAYPEEQSPRTTRLQNLRNSMGLREGRPLSCDENNQSNRYQHPTQRPGHYQPFRDYNGRGTEFLEPSHNFPSQEVSQIQRHPVKSSHPPAYNKDIHDAMGNVVVVPSRHQRHTQRIGLNTKESSPRMLPTRSIGRGLRARGAVDSLQFVERGRKKSVSFDQTKNWTDGDVGRNGEDSEYSSDGHDLGHDKRYDDGYASTTGRLSESDAGGRSRDPQSLHAYSERASLQYAGRQKQVGSRRRGTDSGRGQSEDVHYPWRAPRRPDDLAWSTDDEDKEKTRRGVAYRNKTNQVSSGSRRGQHFDDDRQAGKDDNRKRHVRRGDLLRKLRRDVRGPSANFSDTNSNSGVDEPPRPVKNYKGILKKNSGKTAVRGPLHNTRHSRARYISRLRQQ